MLCNYLEGCKEGIKMFFFWELVNTTNRVYWFILPVKNAPLFFEFV